METTVDGDYVETMIVEKPIRSLLASVDDYLMNLSIADALCDEMMNGMTAGNGTVLVNDEED